MDKFKRFSGKQLDGTTGDNGEKQHVYISDKDYLMCKNIWNEFNLKNMVIITIIVRKRCFAIS